MTSFELDFTAFGDSMRKLQEQALPDALERGLGKAGMQLLRDAAMEMPAVPHKEGTLRGSGSAFVRNKLVGTTESMGKGGTPARDHDDPDDPSTMAVTVGFNTPYAAYQHEGVRADGTHRVQNYSDDGVGAKFLEIKMREFMDDYTAIVEEEIQRSLT